MAERHVAQGKRHIASQKRITAELGRDGHDTTVENPYELQLQHESRLKRITSSASSGCIS